MFALGVIGFLTIDAANVYLERGHEKKKQLPEGLVYQAYPYPPSVPTPAYQGAQPYQAQTYQGTQAYTSAPSYGTQPPNPTPAPAVGSCRAEAGGFGF